MASPRVVRRAGARGGAAVAAVIALVLPTQALASPTTPGAARARSAPGLVAPGAIVTAPGSPTEPADVVSVVLRTPADAVARIRALRRGHAAAAVVAASAAPGGGEAAAVEGWARRAGLAVVTSTAGTVTLSATTPTRLAAAFGTSLRGSGAGVAATSPLRLPAALVPVATAAVGLDSHPYAHPVGLRRAVGPADLSADGQVGPKLWQAYDVPPSPAAGAGETIATVQFDGFDASAVTTFATASGIPLAPGQITLVPVGLAPSHIDPSLAPNGSLEVSLDTEALLAVAPRAKQRVYFAPNTTAGALAVYNQIKRDALAGLVQAVSASWGSCEYDAGIRGTHFDTPADLVAATTVQGDIAAMQAAGVTFSAAAGDNGALDCEGNTADPSAARYANAVDFPASLPQTVAVGGTSVAGAAQTVWNNGVVGGLLSAGGGGFSSYYPEPAYQLAAAAGVDTRHTRAVPDVALDADPNSGFVVVDGTPGPNDGQAGVVGGTSLASPLFAGMLADTLSAAGLSALPAADTDIHTAMYAHPGDFFDVLSGTNGDAGQPQGNHTHGYPALAGYDAASGLGAPQFASLATDLGLPARSPAGYVPLAQPARLLDTRAGTGLPGGLPARLVAGRPVVVQVEGVALPGGSVPSSGVAAAVLNVTAVSPSVPTFLSAGAGTSFLNTQPGLASVPDLVTVPLSPSGTLALANGAGSVDVVADLEGYYLTGAGAAYHPLAVPHRLLDTRATHATLAPGGTLSLAVTTGATTPAAVSAVALNVTAVRWSATSGSVTVYPGGTPPPTPTAVLDPAGPQAVANLVLSGVASDGTVTLANHSAQPVDLLVDLQGYFAGTTGLGLVTIPPTRVAAGSMAAATREVTLLAAPAGTNVAGLVGTLTGVAPAQSTYLTLLAGGAVAPGVSTLNLGAHLTRANAVMVGVADPNGAAVTPLDDSSYPVVQLFNATGSTGALLDVSGYYVPMP